MITENSKNKIISIWDKYILNNKKVIDTKGNDLNNIDEKRVEAIPKLKIIIGDFLDNKIDIGIFKTEIDSFNKQNNLWGFTSIKGQMFFNLLLKTNESEERNIILTKLLKKCITQPKDLDDALDKIDELDKFITPIFSKAPDKRKAPNPGSICYFLSYFWQVHNPQKWPIMYSSLILSFTEIGLWEELLPQKESYKTFYDLNNEIIEILSKHINKHISNWDVEHAFWNFKTVTAYPKSATKSKDKPVKEPYKVEQESALKVASFNIYAYLPPIISNLVELGGESENSSASRGSIFEKSVIGIFKQLGFVVEALGQGSGREPDLIATFREEGVAFIIDAKAYANGYMMSANDERAIKEYISHYCPKLYKEGIKKIGFLIISNSFKSTFDEYINEITWNTDIKRFSLITSDALLHLMAYKIKDQISTSEIINAFVNLGILITSQEIIQTFDDF